MLTEQTPLTWLTDACSSPICATEQIYDHFDFLNLRLQNVHSAFLGFDLKSLPTYPTDLLLRQHMKKKLPGLRKQLLGYLEGSPEIQEEGCMEQTTSNEDIILGSEQESCTSSVQEGKIYGVRN